jgi:hypothetical protein
LGVVVVDEDPAVRAFVRAVSEWELLGAAGAGGSPAEDSAAVHRERLGALFRRVAGRHGQAARWRDVAAGALRVPGAAVDALAAEPVPATTEECASVAARHGVDGWLLQRVVEIGRNRPSP